MSLEVSAYFRDDSGNLEFIGETGETNALAGFEAYRSEFYGSDAVRSLGCRILSRLATEDVYVEAEDLDRLESEVRMLLRRLPEIVSRLSGEPEVSAGAYQARLENVLRMISLAKAHPSRRGGVYIG